MKSGYEKQIEQFKQYESYKIINEITDDDKRYNFSSSNQIFSQQEKIEENEEKQIFVESIKSTQFSEMIVISQIRYNNPRTRLEYKLYIFKAIYKAVKQSLQKTTSIDNKKQLKVPLSFMHFLCFQQETESMVRLFKNDVKLGYVTTSGQIKSTASIYLDKTIADQIHNQQFLMNFKKEQIKVISFFSYFKSYINLSKLTQPVLSIDDDSKTQSSTQAEDSPKIFFNLPPCHQNQYYKQAFIRNSKFKNEFIILSKLTDNDMKTGISIYFVYRMSDDQIYAVKKSHLKSNILTFQDVFSTFGEMTLDQRKIREAKILAKLNHPNILRLHQWWIEEEQDGFHLFMLLDYCSYPAFAHQTNDLLNYAYYYLNPMTNKQKLEQIKSIMSQIVNALQYIHDRGIIHRDLKPENIFVTIDINEQLKVIIHNSLNFIKQIRLADFDQGKDVREYKLCNFADGKIPSAELNSIKSQQTIQSGTSGYTTPNSLKDQLYDLSDEFYALGIILLHLVCTFPGEPKNRNHYTATFGMSDIEDVLLLFDNWANKYINNKNQEFSFELFQNQLELAKKLLDKKLNTHDQIRQIINSW